MIDFTKKLYPVDDGYGDEYVHADIEYVRQLPTKVKNYETHVVIITLDGEAEVATITKRTDDDEAYVSSDNYTFEVSNAKPNVINWKKLELTGDYSVEYIGAMEDDNGDIFHVVKVTQQYGDHVLPAYINHIVIYNDNGILVGEKNTKFVNSKFSDFTIKS